MATVIPKDSVRHAPPPGVGTIAFNFADMRGQADEYLTSVRQEAAKIVLQAHQEAEQVRRQAEAAGRKAAEAAVERVLDEKVARRMDTLLPALEQLLQEINDMKGELQKHWERSATKVATAIAKRIIRREIANQPQITLDLIAESLRLAAGSAEITLYMNPTDHENLGSQAERLAQTLCQLTPSSIVADPTITPGGCCVKTRYGIIDQQIESQLRRIEEELN